MMNTVTLSPEVYHKAATFAQQDQLNVDDWVNKMLLKIVVDYPKKETSAKEPAAKEMLGWGDLAGMFSSDKSDRELLDEYLGEKYGV